MDFTDLYDFKTDNGIVVPDDSEVLLGIQKKFQEIFGAEIDLSAETPVGRLIEAFAVIVKSTLGVTAQSANQFNITATSLDFCSGRVSCLEFCIGHLYTGLEGKTLTLCRIFLPFFLHGLDACLGSRVN